MPETIEKRTVKIPSCVVDKTLIRELGELLENDALLEDRLRYTLDSKTKDVTSNMVKDFIEADWGSGLNKIMIEADDNSPKVNVEINFRTPRLSEYSLSGKDPTWVNGMMNRVEDIFNKHRTSYHRIKKNWFLKMLLTIIITGVLCLPVFLMTLPLATQSLAFFLTPVVLVAGYGGMGVYFLLDWLLPHFEYEGILQKRARKWIWIILFGSGIVPSIILKLLGL